MTSANPVESRENVTRETVLAGIQDEKVRAMIAGLSRPDAYDWSHLFPKTTGRGASGDVKRRVRMLRSLEPRLDYLLFPDERIEFVTMGVLNSFVEQYFMGIWALIINRTMLVFTDMRLILVQCNGSGVAKSMMWQIPYHRIGNYTGSLGVIKFRVDGGQLYTFSGVPGDDRKRLKEYVQSRVARTREAGAEFPSFAGRDSLCPACASPVPAAAESCPECGESFTKPHVPAIMSLIVPGLGHMHLGHHVMAVFEMAGFAIVIAVCAGLTLAGEWPVAVALLATANFIDGAVTYHVAKKGKKLARRAWQP